MDESTPPFRYDARLANEIELKWQQRWEREGTFQSPNPPGADGPGAALSDGAERVAGRPKFYLLHPFGIDTFGLPAEQYAIDTGQHPAVTVRQNAAVMRRQLRRLGLGHDRRREILTSDPSYYRWTQWIFLRIFNSWYDHAAGPLGRARPVRRRRRAWLHFTPDKPQSNQRAAREQIALS